MNQSNKISVSYRLEQSVIDMLNEIANVEKRSKTNVIENIIRKYYENNIKREI